MNLNSSNIENALSSRGPVSRILDLGCWDGASTLRYAHSIQVFGVERSHQAAREAKRRGIIVLVADLNRPLPIRGESFDLVSSNQVIEHLHDTDTFMGESHRILRPDGKVVVSTENSASWHNIFALLLGWQAFSLTNVSGRRPGLGNPLANLRSEEPADEGWEHMRIFSYRGLAELLEAHEFHQVQVRGAGYYPLPAKLGRSDPRHAAFITAIGVRRVHTQNTVRA